MLISRDLTGTIPIDFLWYEDLSDDNIIETKYV